MGTIFALLPEKVQNMSGGEVAALLTILAVLVVYTVYEWRRPKTGADDWM
jgi:hypothetical protein